MGKVLHLSNIILNYITICYVKFTGVEVLHQRTALARRELAAD